MKLRTSIIQGLFLLSPLASGLELYVSPSGDDSADGSAQKPLASLAAAQQRAKAVAGKEAVTVTLADGIYYLPETLVFTGADSGTAEFPITYTAANEGQAVLSGGSLLDLDWKDAGDGVFTATTPAGLAIDQLFINGTQERMARYPNFDASKKDSPYQGYSPDAFSKEKAAGWADPKGAYIHAMHRSRWGGYHFVITGKNAEGEVTYEGGWQNNRKSTIHEEYRMVENVFEELDAEHEWFHNAKTNTLYYIPPAGLDLAAADVEVVRLRHLVELNGTEAAPVKHLNFQGLTVKHAARTFMDTKEQLLRSDWAIYRGGAFFFTGTENISVTDCEFDQVGGNAIFVNGYNRHTTIKGCHIHHTGASGVCFVGSDKALYNPLYEYGERNDLSTIDLTKGPKTNDYPMHGIVEDCLIHSIGTVERQPAGVQIQVAAKVRISDVSVYDCARAGINIGDGAFGGHTIERCDVFSTVLETHDHGSFNSWGRDRYWRPDHLTASQAAVDANPELPFLDAIYTTVIRDSRWRCEHGWDIDLDDGSTNYEIYNNLMLCGGLKLREGFSRKAYNNIVVDNGLSSHVWFSNSNDEVTRNVMARANGAYVLEGADVSGCSDSNFYYEANEDNLKNLQEKFNWDFKSVVGENPFVDRDNGDFSIKPGSKAFDIGFKNFPMDQFGVKKPSLKAIAKTPSFQPKAGKKKAKKATPAQKQEIKGIYTWVGAQLKGLEGEEFSAYGVSKKDGGVVLSGMSKDSLGLSAGFQNNDLVQKINGTSVKTPAQLIAAVAALNGQPASASVVRNQAPYTITVTPTTKAVFESAKSATAFQTLQPTASAGLTVTTPEATKEDSLATLLDGKLADTYGSVFINGFPNGAYKIDLGSAQSIKAVNSWAHHKGSNRSRQLMTIFASNADTDPGWDTANYTELGSFDNAQAQDTYTAASLQSADGSPLGTYRWIIWRTYPVSAAMENSSIQELGVELAQ